MLLSAETALQSEKKSSLELRRKLNDQERNKASQSTQTEADSCPLPETTFHEDHENSETALYENFTTEDERVISLQKSSGLLRAENADLSNKVKSMSTDISRLSQEVIELKSERDAARTSLLEAEIKEHDLGKINCEEVNSLKLQLVKLQTERETLEMTLAIKETEIKARKEECRDEKLVKETMQSSLNSVREKCATIEQENEKLKASNSVRLIRLRDHQKTNDALLMEIDTTKQVLNAKEQEIMKATAGEKQMAQRYEESRKAMEELQQNLAAMSQKLEMGYGRIEGMTKEQLELKRQLKLSSDKCHDLSSTIDNMAEAKKELERSIPSIVESSSTVRELRSDLANREADILEKKQAIKLLQLRASEMKKMLQQEMRTVPQEAQAQPPQPPQPPTTAPTSNRFYGSSPQIRESPSSEHSFDLPNTATGTVNVKYLRNVLFKFLTSPEYEARQMTRAVATLLQFTTEEERLLQEHLEWKMSWFKPKPKLPSSS